MASRNPEIDEYIEKSSDFARPMLARIREAFHAAAKDIEEEIKWSSPAFTRGGRILGGMTAFKAHVGLGFWRGVRMEDPAGIFVGVGNTQMSMAKFTTLAEMPPKKVLVAYVKQAIALEDAARAEVQQGKKPKKVARPAPKAPADLLAALKADGKALATFQGFPPSHKREYVEWILEAKREETRAKRVAQAVEWMAAGKPRNWKYMKR